MYGRTALSKGPTPGAVALHKAVMQAKPRVNAASSPLSLNLALGMAAEGAGGRTAAQLHQVLGWQNAASGRTTLTTAANRLAGRAPGVERVEGVTINIANGCWADLAFPLDDAVAGVIRSAYTGALDTVDFRNDPETARGDINTWVRDATRGRIPELAAAGSVTRDTALYLASALYFGAQWEQKFDRRATQPAAFVRDDAQRVEVQMMNHVDQEFAYHRDRERRVSLVALPYAAQALSMILMLPDRDDGPDLAMLERELTAEILDEWCSALDREWAERKFTRLALPRLSFRSSTSLVAPLKQLGVQDAFDPEAADFERFIKPSERARLPRLSLKNAVQAAQLNVDEEGTSMTFATGLEMTLQSMPPPPVSFVADHPFLFLVRDRNLGAAIAIGRIGDPTVLEG